MINLNLPEYTLSCRLPMSFTIDGTAQDCYVVVAINDKQIYGTTLVAQNGVCTFYEFRTLVHDYMHARSQAVAKLTVEADQGRLVVDDKYVVYADVNVSYEDESDFFASSFLSLQRTIVVPRSQWVTIPLLLTPATTLAPKYSLVFRRKDGTFATVACSPLPFTSGANDQPRIYSLQLSDSSLTNLAKATYGEDYGTLLEASIVMGQRTMELYFVDEEPQLVFSFRNAFNCMEKAFVFGTVKRKDSFEAKEARCNGTLHFYDRTHERRYEVETRALTIEEATHLAQLFSSSSVLMDVTSWQDEEVLFSDVTAEMVNDSTEETRYKFSYRIAAGTCWQDPEAAVPQIFTAQYTPPFT